MTHNILLTGASGYLAKHLLVALLNSGHRVRGTVRSEAKAAALRETMAEVAGDGVDRLDLVVLDLAQDAGWGAAAEGMDVLMHTASPFPMVQPKDAEEVIRPAVDGTLRAMKAAKAAGIERVILTSSTVAIMGCDLPEGRSAYDEQDWTDPDREGVSPYAQSKTLAERAAWAFAEENGIALTTVNPGFILGAPLDKDYGTSIAVIERILRSKDPALPRLSFNSVDVQDIVALHLAALERPETTGQRLMGAGRALWFTEIAEAVQAALPHRKVTTRQAPGWLLRLIALFDPAVRGILPDIGKRQATHPARAEALLGQPLKDPREAVKETAAWLDRNGVV